MSGRAEPPVRLRRDAVTWLFYARYCVFGYFLYAFTPSITLVRDDEKISDAVAGLHGTAYAIGAITIGATAAPILARVGRTRALWLFLAVLCAGVVVYASVPVLAVSLTGALICGAAGSGVAITTGAALTDHHGEAGPAALTEANGVCAAFGLIAPLVVGFFVHRGYGWTWAILATVPLTLLVVLIRLVVPGSDPAPAPARTATSRGRGESLGYQFRLSWTIVVLCVGIEFCMTLWCAQLLRDRVGFSPAAASTGVTALVGGLCLGRLVGARIAHYRGVDWLLWRAFAVTGVGFFLFWQSTLGPLSFAGLALCGLGMSLHYPLGVARAIVAAAGHSDLASARVGLGTGIAIGAAPFLLGYLSDSIGVRYAFLLVPCLLGFAALALLIAGRSSGVVVIHVSASGPAAGTGPLADRTASVSDR